MSDKETDIGSSVMICRTYPQKKEIIWLHNVQGPNVQKIKNEYNEVRHDELKWSRYLMWKRGVNPESGRKITPSGYIYNNLAKSFMIRDGHRTFTYEQVENLDLDAYLQHEQEVNKLNEQICKTNDANEIYNQLVEQVITQINSLSSCHEYVELEGVRYSVPHCKVFVHTAYQCGGIMNRLRVHSNTPSTYNSYICSKCNQQHDVDDEPIIDCKVHCKWCQIPIDLHPSRTCHQLPTPKVKYYGAADLCEMILEVNDYNRRVKDVIQQLNTLSRNKSLEFEGVNYYGQVQPSPPSSPRSYWPERITGRGKRGW